MAKKKAATDLTPLVGSTVRKILDRLKDLDRGNRCPPEEEIAANYRVSRTTVRSALKELESAGILRKCKRAWRLARKIQQTDLASNPPKKPSKEQEVIRHLIDKVASGEIRPGQRLSERTLALELGFSNAPIREALLSICPLGLFRKESGQQWEAIALTARQCEELTELRVVIEKYCLGKMFSTGWIVENRNRLNGLLLRTRKVFRSKRINTRLFFDVDVLLHKMILESSGNKLMMERNLFIYSIIQFQLSNRSFSSQRARFGLEQHIRILEAILDEKREIAEATLVEHLHSALETLKQIGGY